MAIKLIVTDLDGTLLNDQKQVSDRTIAAIRAAQAQGVKVTVATGRMHVAAAYFARKIGADVPVISCNGGLVKEVDGNGIVFANCFAPEVTHAVLAECYQNDWYAQWYIEDRIYAKEFRPEMFSGYKMIEGFKVSEIGDAFSAYTDGVIQIVIRDANGRIAGIQEKIREKFGDRLELQQNTDVSVDITPPGIHKAVGLRHLLEKLGLKRGEVIAFGDADNDLAMLRYAGLSIATKNAIDEAKAIADYVTDDCNHDGVAKAIERYVLKR